MFFFDWLEALLCVFNGNKIFKNNKKSKKQNSMKKVYSFLNSMIIDTEISILRKKSLRILISFFFKICFHYTQFFETSFLSHLKTYYKFS